MRLFFIPVPSPLIRPLSAPFFSEVLKVRLKLDRISRQRQRRLRFLPGSPAASGEAGRLIRDTAETTERLKHTWRQVELSEEQQCVCVCGFTLCGLKCYHKDSLELNPTLSGGGCASVYR